MITLEEDFLLKLSLIQSKSLTVNSLIRDFLEEQISYTPSLKLQELKKKLQVLTQKIPESLFKKNLSLIKKEPIQIISLNDSTYPNKLKHITPPPCILFTKGDIKLLNYPSIAIVGSRKCTNIGAYNAKKISQQLANLKLSIVSGLAKGIDSIAHEAALESSGKTIAVLGCGISQIYPKTNFKLFKAVEKNGLIISEYPPSTPPLSYNFPYRNRIISGLTHCTIVIEASMKSGSLLTAQYALNQGKEVFAMPGHANDINYKGCNSLLKDGANWLEDIENIIDFLKEKLKMELDFTSANNTLSSDLLTDNMNKTRNSPHKDNSFIKTVLSTIEPTPQRLDSILAKLHNYPQQQIVSALTKLEVMGEIKKEFQGYSLTI